MGAKKEWTEAEDATILTMLAAGESWQTLADALGVWKQSVQDHARRRLGVDVTRRKVLAVPTPSARPWGTYDALPAGHPTTWDAITAGTLLEGTGWPG